MRCKLCGEPVRQLAQAEILARFRIQYDICTSCGFVQTENPYWLDEAYSQSIAETDIGLVGRNIKMARVTDAVISLLFNTGGRFLDYGGGTGMLVRLMRDNGFDFYWHDNHTLNQFAAGFEADLRNQYELITAFEVFEHLGDPKATVQEMLSLGDSILFSTRLLPSPVPLPGTWWYYALETGQHISLYSKRSLQRFAELLGLKFHSNGRSIHLLTRRRVLPPLFGIASLPPTASALSLLLGLGRRSLLDQDYFRLTGKHLG